MSGFHSTSDLFRRIQFAKIDWGKKKVDEMTKKEKRKRETTQRNFHQFTQVPSCVRNNAIRRTNNIQNGSNWLVV